MVEVGADWAFVVVEAEQETAAVGREVAVVVDLAVVAVVVVG